MPTEENPKKYITEEIGEEYNSWEPTDIIMITAPTGSGKTYFCLNVLLLERAMKRGERILYLVNRKILKMQLQESLKSISEEYHWNNLNDYRRVEDYIEIETYQSIEKKLKFTDISKLSEVKKFFESRYSIVVYDECHYFYSDSDFNTYTELSYSFLRFCFDTKIQIFMSATMENMEHIIRNGNPLYMRKEDVPSYHVSGKAQFVLQDFTNTTRKYKSYTVKIDYSDVKINYFRNLSDLCMIIKQSMEQKNEKWLIFVDSRNSGRELKSKLIVSGDEDNIEEDNDGKINWREEVVYVDADYRKDTEAQVSVQQLVRDNLIRKKVVIATSVMDNGISFHDLELRNIVILANSKEEFLQMLGRKRKDGKNINLYICMRTRDYFSAKLLSVTKKYEAYDKIASRMDGYFYSPSRQQAIDPLIYYYYFGLWNGAKYRPCCSKEQMLGTQQYILDNMMQDECIYHAIKEVVYFCQGIMANNKFSLLKLHNLKIFYQEMLEAMEVDDMAFLRKQMEWLGVNGEEAEKTAVKVKLESKNLYMEKIIEVLKTFEGKSLSKEENLEIKGKIKEYLKFLIKKKDGMENCYNEINKNGRPLSINVFNACMDALNIPFIMKKDGRSNFIIRSKKTEVSL